MPSIAALPRVIFLPENEDMVFSRQSNVQRRARCREKVKKRYRNTAPSEACYIRCPIDSKPDDILGGIKTLPGIGTLRGGEGEAELVLELPATSERVWLLSRLRFGASLTLRCV